MGTTTKKDELLETMEQEFGTKEVMVADGDYLSGFAGDGLDGFVGSSVSMPYLTIVQSGSSRESEVNKVGDWVNTATGANYGRNIKVIPVAFRTIWLEKDPSTFTTVGRYPVGGIKVKMVAPIGGKGFPKMINEATGFEISEAFLYVLYLVDHPEDGYVYYCPSAGSMRTCRAWNTSIKTQLLPNGKRSPIFGYSWNLVSDLVSNPKKPAAKMGKFVEAIKCEMTGKETFTTYIAPNLQDINESILQIGSDNNSEVEEVDG